MAAILRTVNVAAAPTGGKGLALTLGRQIPTNVPACAIRMLTADPASPRVGETWYRTDTHQFSVQEAGGVKRVTLA